MRVRPVHVAGARFVVKYIRVSSDAYAPDRREAETITSPIGWFDI